jgi:delta 1-pyrroline-5-carboxylate dehydrogenase
VTDRIFLNERNTSMSQHDNLINGQWTAADSYSANTNPSDLSDVIGEYAQGNAADVEAAIAAAAAAFPAWSTSGIQARHDALDKIGNEILARKEELERFYWLVVIWLFVFILFLYIFTGLLVPVSCGSR